MARWTSTLALLAVTLAGAASAESPPASMDPFGPFSGVEWVGHYVGTEDSALVHYVRWDPILGGVAVKETKRVPELGFRMETCIFLDHEHGQLAFLALDSRGGMGRGKISFSDGEIVYSGTSIFPGGSAEFRKTFEILDSGMLRDRFYRKVQDGSWVQGHLILYQAEKQPTDLE